MQAPKWVKEMGSWTGWTGWADVSRAVVYGPISALRTLFTGNFFHRPKMDKTVVSYELARSLYRNDNPNYNLGAGFCKPIIDLAVEYIGLPAVSAANAKDDEFLNNAIVEHWAPQIQQMFRTAMRDSKIVVRFRQPLLDNPLFTEEDRTHGKLELIPPEECELTFDPSDPDRLQRAVVTHWVNIDDRTAEEIINGTTPSYSEHEILEIVTEEEYAFYDKTVGSRLDSWTTPNRFRFVPLWPVWNEYEPDLGGGQSDFESVLPFIEAFHDTLLQALAAHQYHSTPKVKFKLRDVLTFIRNNWPEVIDETTGKIKEGANINWSGRQIFFFQTDEDGAFMEAKSVLGDSKTLLEFLIECICIASEIPRWAMLSTTTNVPETDATVQPFEKKITRKRIAFQEFIVMICKMALAANGRKPETPRITWAPVRLQDLVNKGQSLQQIILGLDVASQHQWVSDATAIKILGSLFSEVGSPDEEKREAADNIVPEIPAPAPQSPTQALPPGGANGSRSTNGSGNKAAGKRALTTTTPSKS